MRLRGIERVLAPSNRHHLSARESRGGTPGAGFAYCPCMLEALRHDIRHALRLLRRSPGFTTIAVGTLALGIGGSTVMFAMADAVIWRALPFRDPDRLVHVHEMRLDERTPRYASLANFADWRESESFAAMAAYTDAGFVLTGRGEPQRLSATQVSAQLFTLLGVQPALGRSIAPDEDRQGGTPVAILSDRLWRQRFEADPSVVGRGITLNGRAYVVNGVMPAGFQFPIGDEDIDLYTPLEQDAWPTMRLRDGRLIRVLARLHAGVSLSEAQAEMSAIAARLATAYPDTNRNWGTLVTLLREDIAGASRSTLLMLLGAVGFVLLIACANLANLSLARTATRRGEFAVRAALGAGHARLIRQIVTESVVMAALGGAAALLVFSWLRDLVIAVAPRSVPRLTEVGLDARTVLFAMLVSLAAGVLVALGSVGFAFTADHRLATRQDRGAGGRATGNAMRSALLVAEVALAIVLLTGAGLMTKSLLHLTSVDPGFRTTGVYVADLLLSLENYGTGERRMRFFDRVLDELRRVPGVRSASVAFSAPFGSRVAFPIEIEGRPPSETPTSAYYRSVGAEYFSDLDIPLLRGRLFSDQDRPAGAPVVIVNHTLAERYWPGEDPIGKRFTVVDRNDSDRRTRREVVGVVRDVRHRGLDLPSGPEMYVPYRQAPSPWMSVFITVDRGADVAQALGAAVQAVDANLPVGAVEPLEDRVLRSVAPQRFMSILLSGFALVALALTTLGIAGVTAYAITQRTQEIGIRVALGAVRKDILTMLLGGTLRLALAGTAIGIVGAVGLTGLLSTMLFDVSALDVPTFVLAAIALPVLALIATLLPSRRALRIDPMKALRSE